MTDLSNAALAKPIALVLGATGGVGGALAEALPHCALTQIVQGVDDIRCLARDHGFAAVETLASRLESAVAGGGYRAAILTYLDAMSDAVAAPRDWLVELGLSGKDPDADLAAAREEVGKLHPLGHMGEPDDIAWGVVYLASDQARWVTGAELVIDGGYTAR